jgi:hypothetical protein
MPYICSSNLADPGVTSFLPPGMLGGKAIRSLYRISWGGIGVGVDVSFASVGASAAVASPVSSAVGAGSVVGSAASGKWTCLSSSLVGSGLLASTSIDRLIDSKERLVERSTIVRRGIRFVPGRIVRTIIKTGGRGRRERVESTPIRLEY